MQRQFASRDDLIAYVQAQFPAAAGPASPTLGGVQPARDRLAQIQPQVYGTTRNDLDGAVTHLSPYLRHGVVSLAQVRRTALAKAGRPADAEKLLQQLAWRDYWQRLYRVWGEGIWQDREPYKTGFTAEDYATVLPENLEAGATGWACMDHFSQDLQTLGYLHNHARLWLAAYVVHWCRVRWQVGAHWFLRHLLDGDPASNNLSWQWVASTFSRKPYYFNRVNLERYTEGRFCRACPHYGHCPFEGTYEALAGRLFPQAHFD
ncbi:MAG: deoxyribodipyrimidine photo-lyase [Gloeomargaritaceae cyanobacterium C42_A2020_066]|nr:deoxyribodipyrimidine photo-lyase [Gloeomargaritaceae cyanobacterium C42_A2020_066]